VIGILDQELQLSERHRVRQEAEMMAMQRRANYDVSHHGMTARISGPSGTGTKEVVLIQELSRPLSLYFFRKSLCFRLLWVYLASSEFARLKHDHWSWSHLASLARPKTRQFCLPTSSDKFNDFRRRFASLPSDPSIPDKLNISHFPTTSTSWQPADLGQPPDPGNPHIMEMATSRTARKSRNIRTTGAAPRGHTVLLI
jgi:hypothetical protein